METQNDETDPSGSFSRMSVYYRDYRESIPFTMFVRTLRNSSAPAWCRKLWFKFLGNRIPPAL